MAASNISDKDMILLMYGETFDKQLYREWKKGKVIPVPFAVPVSAAGLAHLSDGVKARLSPSYLNVNFSSWQQTSVAPGAPTLPTLVSTVAVNSNTTKTELLYNHDGFKWFSDFRIFVRYAPPHTYRTFVLHLPNDGFFYTEKSDSDQDVATSNVNNPRHITNCYNGWFLLKDEVWDRLVPILTYMTNWLGTTAVDKKIMYHAVNNRVDIIVSCPVNKVAFEISFEQRFAMEMKEGFW
mmetsp:Transcript_13970/g.13766  ORF Transcript_13970/g.13766 Transcript_13970/m.13766 type:complete len:238 (-) Transcript_13970:1194-1907(-)